MTKQVAALRSYGQWMTARGVKTKLNPWNGLGHKKTRKAVARDEIEREFTAKLSHVGRNRLAVGFYRMPNSAFCRSLCASITPLAAPLKMREAIRLRTEDPSSTAIRLGRFATTSAQQARNSCSSSSNLSGLKDTLLGKTELSMVPDPPN
jgi:hypothetical protein